MLYTCCLNVGLQNYKLNIHKIKIYYTIDLLIYDRHYLQARSLQSNKLELHFRPEDPYSHPAFGELHPCNSFLLRISKKIGRNGQSAEDNRISKCLSEDDIHLSQKSCPESVRTDQVDECESASQLPEEVQEDLSADIVTRISEAYQFNG